MVNINTTTLVSCKQNIFWNYQAKLYTRFRRLLYAQFSGFKYLAKDKRHWPITGLFSESAFILGCSTSVEVHARSCLSMHKSDTMVDIPAAKVDIEALPIYALHNIYFLLATPQGFEPKETYHGELLVCNCIGVFSFWTQCSSV